MTVLGHFRAVSHASSICVVNLSVFMWENPNWWGQVEVVVVAAESVKSSLLCLCNCVL